MRGNEERFCLCLENVRRGGVAARKISVLNPDLNGYDWGLSCQSAFRIGTVESRRYLVSQPFGYDTSTSEAVPMPDVTFKGSAKALVDFYSTGTDAFFTSERLIALIDCRCFGKLADARDRSTHKAPRSL